MALNKDHLKVHVTRYNELFTNKIIEIIKDDVYWLGKLGVKKADIKIDESISEIIKTKLSNPANKESIDLILKYVIGDYLMEDDELPLIKHVVSADSHWQLSSLFVFKCSELYFCYSNGVKTETLITEEPEAFCWETAGSIIDYYEMEKENLKDEWFKESDSYNELQQNFNFNKY
jgi:hypothetical protein